jgi:GAF domain-containing protein
VTDDGYSAHALSRNEALRQAELFASGALGMGGNPVLTLIVSRVAALMQTPIAAISIVDRDRQWFPAFVGPFVEEMERGASFCAHAILQPGETLCVPDAALDARFTENRFVIGPPHIRFYAGMPIVNHRGAALGALCALDPEARPAISPEQERGLRELADEAVREINRIEHLRRYAADAIHHIVPLIRDAAEKDDEDLLLALDQVLRRIETELNNTNAPS